MNHPLKRLFTPISVIILIAASSVAVSTADTSDPRHHEESVAEPARDSTETPEAVVAIQAVADRSWND